MKSENQQPPFFGPNHPIYPPHLQLIKVLSGTIPGPSGYASSSVLGPSIYLGTTQQLLPSTLLPRDREPCLALDVNRTGLAPAYYLGRLSGSYRQLPLYEVTGGPVSPLAGLSSASGAGLTPTQVEQLSTLSPSQLDRLNNLTTCQLKVLVDALPISQIQTLTSGVITSTQLSNLVNESTTTQLTDLYNNLTTSQIITLTSTLNQDQISYLENTITGSQIRTLVTNLTTTQLQSIVKYPAVTISNISTAITNNTLTTTNLQTLLNNSPLPTTPIDTSLVQTSTFTSGTQNNVPIFGNTLKVPTTGSTTITGFIPLNPNSAQKLKILNTGSADITISHQSGSSSPANQVKTSTGSALTIPSGASLTIAYDPGTGYWTDDASSVSISQSGSSGGTTSTNGSSELGSPYNVTTSMADTGLQVTLPDIGTYDISCFAVFRLSDTFGAGGTGGVRLRHEDAGVNDVTYDVVLTTNTQVHVGTANIIWTVTTSAINEVVKLQATYSAFTVGIAQIPSGARMKYIRLS